MAGSSEQQPLDLWGFVERLHRVEEELRARGLVHLAAHIHGAWPGHGGRSPATNVDSSTAASSPPSGALGVDTADSPRPLRDPWAPRPAVSSVRGYYLNGDNGDNERTASNAAVAPRRQPRQPRLQAFLRLPRPGEGPCPDLFEYSDSVSLLNRCPSTRRQ